MRAKMVLWLALVVVVVVAVAMAPLPWPETRLVNATDIARPPAEVYAYVTTPGHWPEWHPASRSVRGAVDHSLARGEQVTENFVVAGRTGEVVWSVIDAQPPERWRIEGWVGDRAAGTIRYTLTPAGDATHFEREFVYGSRNLVFALLNWAELRPKVEAESARALENLKRTLEAGK